MKYIEAPNFYSGPMDSVFLAGGITNCPDWQQEIVKRLEGTSLVLLNPRRSDFGNADIRDQIGWEFIYLRRSSAVLFWFPCETICPIVLFELGVLSTRTKQIFVGVHREYERRSDVEIQLSLARPEVKVVYSLYDLAAQVVNWAGARQFVKP
jgi:hypothetical protein